MVTSENVSGTRIILIGLESEQIPIFQDLCRRRRRRFHAVPRGARLEAGHGADRPLRLAGAAHRVRAARHTEGEGASNPRIVNTDDAKTDDGLCHIKPSVCIVVD